MHYTKISQQRNVSFESGRPRRNPSPAKDLGFDADDLARLGIRFLRPNASRWHRQGRGNR